MHLFDNAMAFIQCIYNGSGSQHFFGKLLSTENDLILAADITNFILRVCIVCFSYVKYYFYFKVMLAMAQPAKPFNFRGFS